MHSLETMPISVRQKTRYVLTDIDDTLTDNGSLEAKTFAALAALRDSGRKVVPVTGRSAGWCDHMARMWPVEGIIGENGAFYFRYDHGEKRMIRRYVREKGTRLKDRMRLDSLCQKALDAVPGCALAADQPYRDTDLAIDFREDVPPLPEADAEKVLKIFTEAGFQGNISSIHVNVWCGDYSKLTTTHLMFKEIFDEDLKSIIDEVVYIGDSPNDESMFTYFPNSIGVANILDFKNFTKHPTYMTDNRGGKGFAEFSKLLISSNGS
ncbi:HAD family hydrolase [Maridesulfovibrio frigidus]|uniref:HAD family hydrolase n=1 Tax=Maridesulfovibrio frigidus TaxID=340956 RepID=UPI0004E2784E|nr:HAD-IIB family hydrolase [Maridesulfovibrio frigidus]